jgi:hypothetical protein
MKHTFFLTVFMLFLLSLLPGCRYGRWLQDVFYQGQKGDKHLEMVHQYIRSEHVYDQFTTLGHFDALWLSNEVRAAYANVYACKHCLNDERYNAFLRRQLEENNHYISFYVLASIPECCGSRILSDNDAVWSLCLKINGNMYRPIEIKIIDLLPEYCMFFDKYYTRFKTPYLVRFDARDISDHSLIHAGIRSIELHFNRADRRAVMIWCLDNQGRVIRQRLNHPNRLAYDLDCC